MKLKTSSTIINILLIIAIVSCKSKNIADENNLKDLDLFGQISRFSETTYRVSEKFGEVNKSNFIYDTDARSSHISFYNKDGYVIKNTFLNEDGLNNSINSYEYSKNKTIKKDIHSADLSLYSKTSYQYNDSMQLIKKIVFDDNGNIIETKKYKNNSNGNKIKITTYDKFNIMTSIEENTFDESFNIIKKTIYNEDREIIELIKVEILESKKKKIERHYDKDGELSKVLTFKNSNIKSKELYKYDKIIKKFIYEDDNYGNIYKNSIFKNNGDTIKIYSYEYKYDKKNNWIERVFFEDGKPIGITERKISYYDDSSTEFDLLFSKSLEQDSSNYYMSLAGDEIYNENFNEAEEYINLGFDHYENNSKGYYLKAKLNHEYNMKNNNENLSEKCFKFLRKALDLNNYYVTAYSKLGYFNIYYKTDYEKSKTVYTTLVNNEIYGENYYNYYLKGLCNSSLKNNESALEDFTTFILNNKENKELEIGYSKRAGVKYALGKDYCDDLENACKYGSKKDCEYFSSLCK